jgi:hypothetical protein
MYSQPAHFQCRVGEPARRGDDVHAHGAMGRLDTTQTYTACYLY